MEVEEGIGVGIETEVEAGADLEAGVMIEGQRIMVDMREHDDLNVYSILYGSVHLVLLNKFYYSAGGGMTFFNQLVQSFVSCVLVE